MVYIGFEVRCSIQLSYERVRGVDYQTWPDRASRLLPGRPRRRAGSGGGVSQKNLFPAIRCPQARQLAADGYEVSIRSPNGRLHSADQFTHLPTSKSLNLEGR